MPPREIRRFAALVTSARERLGLSQADLGRRLGTGPEFISFVEASKRKPALQKLPLWAATLDIELRALAIAWIAEESAIVAESLARHHPSTSDSTTSGAARALLATLESLSPQLREAVVLIIGNLTSARTLTNR